MNQIEIRNLTFTYPTARNGKAALKNIDLEVKAGEYITICGKSGSGKTTLLKHLKSVLAPHGSLEGEILFEGRPISEADLREQSSKIGYVMQNPDNQIVTDKVWHELAFGLESLGMDQKTIRLRVAEMASYFGIQGWFHRDVSELSGGQKQLLNLASIMAMQPSVLILDEPTSQLDPIAATDFLNTVRKINQELGTTIIITEHRLEDIYYASDRVVVMDRGEIAVCGEPRKVGDYLKSTKSDMFTAMPTPVQVYYGVRGSGAGAAVNGENRGADGKLFSGNCENASEEFSLNECPLTVREGRSWLSGYFAGQVLHHTAVEKDAEAGDIGVPAVMIKEAWFRYEKNSHDVLKGTSLGIAEGSIHAIVGGNGTGKSTLLKCICNICRPYRGQILIKGKRVEKYSSSELFRNNLAMLPQDPQSLFVKKTVREDLAEMGAKIDEAVKMCEIEELLESHPYDLSGGEQQRVALAKVMLTDPKILLLDEPTKGIDNFFKLKFAEIIRKLSDSGVTVIMVSHDVEFCARYADYVSMFFDGGIVTTNTPNAFFARNSFYTTAANRMSRHLFENAITNEDVISLCRLNDGQPCNVGDGQKYGSDNEQY